MLAFVISHALSSPRISLPEKEAHIGLVFGKVAVDKSKQGVTWIEAEPGKSKRKSLNIDLDSCGASRVLDDGNYASQILSSGYALSVVEKGQVGVLIFDRNGKRQFFPVQGRITSFTFGLNRTRLVVQSEESGMKQSSIYSISGSIHLEKGNIAGQVIDCSTFAAVSRVGKRLDVVRTKDNVESRRQSESMSAALKTRSEFIKTKFSASLMDFTDPEQLRTSSKGVYIFDKDIMHNKILNSSKGTTHAGLFGAQGYVFEFDFNERVREVFFLGETTLIVNTTKPFTAGYGGKTQRYAPGLYMMDIQKKTIAISKEGTRLLNSNQGLGLMIGAISGKGK